MADYLIGSTATPSGGIGSANVPFGTLFTCAYGGDISEFKLYAQGSGNVKVGLYSVSAGNPSIRLAYNNTGTAVSAGWNTISISGYSLLQGVDYYLFAVSDSNLLSEEGPSGTSKESAGSYPYSTGLPSSWAGGFFNRNYILSYNIYGTLSSISYESDLGTGSMSMSSGTPSASVTRLATLGSGTMTISGGSLAAIDARLGTGNLSMSGVGIDPIKSMNADLGTVNLVLGASGINVYDYFFADLGTGNMSMSGGAIQELYSYEGDPGTGNLSLSADPILTADGALLDHNQERAFAIAAERMRTCVFADNFASAYKTRQIGGTVAGSPTYTNSVTLDGLSYVTYNEQALTDVFSAVVKFSAGSVSNGVLFGTVDPINPSVDGWRIWVDATGIRANHSDGTAIGTQCTIDYGYADGEIHTVTYVVDMVSGDHVLYVDTEDDSQSTTATGTIGSGRQLAIGGVGFTGTVQKARLFNSELTADEHAVYYADSLLSIFDDSIATYRCDTVSDHTDHIWTKTLNQHDLTKGDGVSAGYPTISSGYYIFDGVNDYVSNWPEQPATHTDSVAIETTGYPYIQQENDDTIKTLLTTGGSLNGSLYSLVLCNGGLTDLEKNHLEYRQLFYTSRGYADGIENQLIVEGTCVLSHYYEDSVDYLDDYSLTNASTIGTDETWDNGITFPLSTSLLTVSDESALRLNKFSVNISGSGLDDVSGTEYLFFKSGNYYLTVSPIDSSTFSVDFNGATATLDRGEITQISVTSIDGVRPRFYANGQYAAEGSTTVTLDDSTTNDLIIGNDAGGNQFSGTLTRLQVYNSTLTDVEITHLYNISLREII